MRRRRSDGRRFVARSPVHQREDAVHRGKVVLWIGMSPGGFTSPGERASELDGGLADCKTASELIRWRITS